MATRKVTMYEFGVIRKVTMLERILGFIPQAWLIGVTALLVLPQLLSPPKLVLVDPNSGWISVLVGLGAAAIYGLLYIPVVWVRSGRDYDCMRTIDVNEEASKRFNAAIDASIETRGEFMPRVTGFYPLDEIMPEPVEAEETKEPEGAPTE